MALVNGPGLRLSLAACTLVSVFAMAQPAALQPGASERRVEELFEVRLRAGLIHRSGLQQVPSGPLLDYSGVTLNDPGVSAWVFPLLGGHLGAHAGFSREGFSLYEPTFGTRLTGGGLLRLHGAATARVRFGPVRLEPIAGYSFNQLADFGDVTWPTLMPAGRHAVLLAARASLDVGPITFEARFDGNMGLLTRDGTGARARSNGLGGGAGVRFSFLRTGQLLWGVLADGSVTADWLSSDFAARQLLVRAGLSLDVQWRAPDRPPLSGLRVAVVFDETGGPAPTAAVTLTTRDGPYTPTLSADGRVEFPSLEPGSDIEAMATLDGHDDARGAVSLTPGEVGEVVLRLKRSAPKGGVVVVTVIDKDTKAALAGATASADGKTGVTDASGTTKLEGVTPGVVSITISAPGYTDKAEATTVLAGLEAAVSTELVLAGKREPATVSGFVRSAGGGAPVPANLGIPEAGLKARADARGAFSFRLPGGTYTVTISAKGFVTQTKQVTVREGDQAIFNVDLQPK